METLRELLKTGSLKISVNAADFLPIAIFRVQLADERFIYANERFTALTGYRAADFPADSEFWRVLFGEAEAPRLLRALAEQLEQEGKISLRCRFRHKDGGALMGMLQGDALWKNSHGVYLECVLQPDVLMRRSAGEARCAAIEEDLASVLFDWDLRTDAIVYAPAFEKQFGYRIPPEETLAFLQRSDCVYEADKAVLAAHLRALREGSSYSEAEYRVRKACGRYVWCKSSAKALLDESGQPQQVVGLLVEVDSYKVEAEAFKAQAQRDETTGLLTKAAFLREAQVALAMSTTRGGALLLLDLDDFKQVNEHFGRAFGDKVLRSFAQAILEVFASDALCGRFGGGTYVVFLPEASRAQTEDKVGQFFTRALQRTEKNDFLLRCCIGGAIGAPRVDFESLFDRADVALYEAKAQGKSRYILL